MLVDQNSTGGDSGPLVRLTGDEPSKQFFTTSGNCHVLPAGTFNQIRFVIATGGDDLRGDSSASATLFSTSGSTLEVVTIKAKDDAGFGNNSRHTIDRGLAHVLNACEIGSVEITLTSHNSFPETNDNWNIQSIIVSLVGSQGGPVLVDKSSSGSDSDPLVRLTGDKPSITFPVQAGECNDRAPAATTSVTTYHNDAQRTGWNKTETTLKPSNVTASSFGLLAVTGLDDQVDTQPLVVIDPTVVHGLKAKEAVVYVASEGNTIFAIDSLSGSILKQEQFGEPVPETIIGCNNNGPNIGIDGTPVIDLPSRTMFFIAYTLVSGAPTHFLHAIDLATLRDRPGSPLKITATQELNNNSSYTFEPKVTRQRPALLSQPGTSRLYAGFGSYCDNNADQSRGWVLGFNKQPLSPLSTSGSQVSELNNQLATGGFFLTSVWMSGYGIAADPDSGSIYFTTGNSKGGSFNPQINLSASAIKLSPVFQMQSSFTPSNVNDLDNGDTDFGSGGLMVLPDQPLPANHLAVAAGKDGRMWIMNRDNMGGHMTTGDAPVNVPIGGCWCGPSYFETSSGHFVVSSGGRNIEVWSVPSFSNTASAALPEDSGQDDGFFTSVSSNGTEANTAVIWAVGRQFGTDNHVSLFAFDVNPNGASLSLTFQDDAGYWPNGNANANIVPTVANGRVYVASDGILEIFGPFVTPAPGTGARALKGHALALHQALVAKRPKYTGAEFWGTVKSVNGTTMTLELRTGKTVEVDVASATHAGHIAPVAVGHSVYIRAKTSPLGVLEAESAQRAKKRTAWGGDHPEAPHPAP